MAKSTTEQNVKSVEDKILGDIAFKDFFAICSEYQIAKDSTMKLLEIADNPKTPLSTKVHIHMWLLDKIVPNPKQSVDLGGDMNLKIINEFIDGATS